MAVRTLTIDTGGKYNSGTIPTNNISISNGTCIHLIRGGKLQINVGKPNTTSLLKFGNKTFNIRVSNKIPNISIDNSDGYAFFWVIEPLNPKSNNVLYLYNDEITAHFKNYSGKFEELIEPYKAIYAIGTSYTGGFGWLPSGNYKLIGSSDIKESNSFSFQSIAPSGSVGISFGFHGVKAGETVETLLSSFSGLSLVNNGTINTLNIYTRIITSDAFITNNGVINNFVRGSIFGTNTGIFKRVTGSVSTAWWPTFTIDTITAEGSLSHVVNGGGEFTIKHLYGTYWYDGSNYWDDTTQTTTDEFKWKTTIENTYDGCIVFPGDYHATYELTPDNGVTFILKNGKKTSLVIKNNHGNARYVYSSNGYGSAERYTYKSIPIFQTN